MIWGTDDLDVRWPIKTLASLTTKIGSGATPRGGRSSYPPDGVPLIRSQNVRFEGFTSAGLAFLTDSQAQQLDGVTVEAGDVLLNITGASIGRVCVAPEEMDGARVNQHVCIIRPAGVCSAFLASYLSSPQVQDAIGLGNYGVTREALTKSQILELPVPVPSLSEQDALVSTIGGLSGRRSQALTRLASARRAVEQVHQSVLAAATSGRLTTDWRDTHQHASPVDLDLARQRRLREPGRRFREPQSNSHRSVTDLPEGWVAGPLGLVLRELKYGTSKKSEYGAEGIPVLRIPNISGDSLDVTDLKSSALGADEAESLRLSLGDLLMIRSNGSVQLVGKTLPVTDEAVGMAYAGYLMRLRSDPQAIVPAYLSLALASPALRRQIEMPARSTSGVNNINTDEVRGLVVAIPPIEEQREIVARASALLQLVTALRVHLDAAGRQVERSSQALLAKAFRGGLSTDVEVEVGA